MSEPLNIEVVYALPQKQTLLRLAVEDGCTVEQVIRQSGILTRFPELDLVQIKVGIYGHLVPLSQPLKSGDRVELYRPLTADPRQMRRKRAEMSTKGKA